VVSGCRLKPASGYHTTTKYEIGYY